MKRSTDCSNYIYVRSQKVSAFWGSDTVRGLTVANCHMTAVKQWDDFITILQIFRWAGDFLIYELHTTGASTGRLFPASLLLGRCGVSASFHILPDKSSGLQYASSEIHVHVAARPLWVSTSNRALLILTEHESSCGVCVTCFTLYEKNKKKLQGHSKLKARSELFLYN